MAWMVAMWQFPVLVDSEILVSRSCLIRGCAVGWKNRVAANIMARKRVGCSSLTKARVWTVLRDEVQLPFLVREHWPRQDDPNARSGSRRTINGLRSRVNLFTAKRSILATYLVKARISDLLIFRLSLTYWSNNHLISTASRIPKTSGSYLIAR